MRTARLIRVVESRFTATPSPPARAALDNAVRALGVGTGMHKSKPHTYYLECHHRPLRLAISILKQTALSAKPRAIQLLWLLVVCKLHHAADGWFAQRLSCELSGSGTSPSRSETMGFTRTDCESRAAPGLALRAVRFSIEVMSEAVHSPTVRHPSVTQLLPASR